MKKKCFWCKRRFHCLPIHRMWCNALRKQGVSLTILDWELKAGDLLLSKGDMLKTYPEHGDRIKVLA